MVVNALEDEMMSMMPDALYTGNGKLVLLL